MSHIQDLNIESFRGIQNLKLENLSNINILLGKNNCGKTSILEAISVLEYPEEIGNYIQAVSKRDSFGISKLSYYSSFINTFNMNKENTDMSVAIKSLINGNNTSLRMEAKQRNLLFETISYPVAVVDVTIRSNKGEQTIRIDEMYDKGFNINFNEMDKTINIIQIASSDYMLKDFTNDVVKSGNKRELIEVLKIFDEDIIGLEMVGERERTVPYIEHNSRGLMPLSTYGDGLRKVLLMASAVVQAKKGVLLIDEVETGIHYSALVDIFRWFVKACRKFDVQVFMTSHSIEVVDAMIESIDESDVLKQDLRVITLRKNSKSQTKVRILDGLDVQKSREEFNLELR